LIVPEAVATINASGSRVLFNIFVGPQYRREDLNLHALAGTGF
jgi:hypothetical protein